MAALRLNFFLLTLFAYALSRFKVLPGVLIKTPLMQHFAFSLLAMNINRVLENLFKTFFSNSLAKMHKVTWIERELVLKIGLAAKILHVRIHDPGYSQGLISQIINPFEYQTSYH